MVHALQLVQTPRVQHLGRLRRLDEQSLRVSGGGRSYGDVAADHKKHALNPVGARADGFLHGEEEAAAVGGSEGQVVAHVDQLGVEGDDVVGVFALLEVRCEIGEIGGERSVAAAFVASDGYEFQRGGVVEHDLNEMVIEERGLHLFEERRIIDGS